MFNRNFYKVLLNNYCWWVIFLHIWWFDSFKILPMYPQTDKPKSLFKNAKTKNQHIHRNRAFSILKASWSHILITHYYICLYHRVVRDLFLSFLESFKSVVGVSNNWWWSTRSQRLSYFFFRSAKVLVSTWPFILPQFKEVLYFNIWPRSHNDFYVLLSQSQRSNLLFSILQFKSQISLLVF